MAPVIAFVVGLHAEARLLRGLGMPVFVGGGGPVGAASAAAAAVRSGAGALVSFGLAGGLDPALPAGTLVNPREVICGGRHYPACVPLAAALGGITADRLLATGHVVVTAASKAGLFAASQAAAVDLESGAVAAAASAGGLAFAVLRAICDPASRDLPPAALAALDAGGSIRIWRLVGSLARRPGQIGPLLQLGREAALARSALAGRVATLIAGQALQSVVLPICRG